MKNVKRCPWADRSTLLQTYHDKEWGVPKFGEPSLFTALSLEIFQAGLPWELILKKQKNLYQAFDKFDYQKIAEYSLKDLNQLLNNSAIIRNRAKIAAVIHNARELVKLHCRKITLTNLTWRLVNFTPLDHLVMNPNNSLDYSEFIKPFLIKFRYYNFKRIGPKTLYSYLQAVGVINDHWVGCYRHSEISKLT